MFAKSGYLGSKSYGDSKFLGKLVQRFVEVCSVDHVVRCFICVTKFRDQFRESNGITVLPSTKRDTIRLHNFACKKWLEAPV
jgi:hypothetical protein